MTEQRSSHEILWDLIKDIRFCMLSHRHPDGSLHSHPLTTHNRTLDADATLWFLVSRSTELGQRLREDRNVNLSYADPKRDAWVSITGSAMVVEDAQKQKDLFDSMDLGWFKGPQDPDLELVAVKIEEAEYWNVKENKLMQMLKLAKATATGKRPQIGEHAEVHF